MEPHPKVNPPKVALCPHCGNITPHQCVYREDYSEVIDETEEGDPIWDECWYAILKCTTCSKPSLYVDKWDNDQKTWKGSLVYPMSQFAPKEVPTKIRSVFNEAMLIAQRSPSLAAVGIRKCLEGVSEDQNAQGRTLAQKISFLGSNGLIPKQLTDMMDVGRDLGNVGAHFGESTITQEQLKSLIEFTLAIFEYLYVAPAKIEAFRKSLEKRKIVP